MEARDDSHSLVIRLHVEIPNNCGIPVVAFVLDISEFFAYLHRDGELVTIVIAASLGRKVDTHHKNLRWV